MTTLRSIMTLVHHLRKARKMLSDDGLVEVAKSAIRFVPIEVNNQIFRLRHGTGTHVMQEDWDNLLILDACRYDMFADHIELDGTLESRISLGSSSEEFLERNFASATHHDTVYVNANPYIPRLDLDEGTFHAVIDCINEWDQELETIRPETVANATRKAHKTFNDKRLIAHFMQPHHPFIGEAGKNLRGTGLSLEADDERDTVIWEYLESGSAEVSLDEVWEAYNENLDIVLTEVESLLDDLDGKSVITADHGNLLGERLSPIPSRRKFGHPYGVHTKELVKIPWFVVEEDTRKTVRADPPVEGDHENISEAELEDRLEALGYR